MAIVGEGARSRDWHATLFTEARPETEERPTNSQSIADLSGIPRESVRRKLAILERKGWIELDAAGTWHPTRKAARDLEGATRETLLYLNAIATASTAQVRL